MSYFMFAVLGAAIVLALVYIKQWQFGFLAQSPEDYDAERGAHFDLRQHLNGPILCEGVIYGPFGRVTSRFIGHFNAEWEGASGVMRERFEYDNGETQDREWHLTLGEDGAISAKAVDIVGTGRGWQRGGVVQMRYRIRLPAGAGGHVLNASDWMYLLSNGTIMNRSQFRIFGIKVAELVATMRKKDAT